MAVALVWLAALAAWALATDGPGQRPVPGTTEPKATVPNETSEFRYPGVPMTGSKCECLNWKKLYEAERLWCGEGLEFFEYANWSDGVEKEQLLHSMTEPTVHGLQIYAHICSEFFAHLDSNRCINMGGFGWDPDDWKSTSQWCYVPFSCQELHGGARFLRKPVSWKICKQGEDSLLRDASPMEIFRLFQNSTDQRILGTAMRYSWPSLRPELWWDLKKKWKARDFKGMPQMLQSAIKHNVPLLIETLPLSHAAILAPKKILFNGTLWALTCMRPLRECLWVEDEFGHPEL
uniref:Uncharacterized protein n=1 Tax=Pyrodinium bahamense TaxID=73915 RepID=A0A7S0FKW0_9DINO